jgi:hypothetical protein
MTAIAAVEVLTDEVLSGLRPCIRHQSAIGFWNVETLILRHEVRTAPPGDQA